MQRYLYYSILGFFLLPSSCFALQEKPWFGDLCEFHFRPQYEYNFFDEVSNALPPQEGTFNTHVATLGFDTTIPDTWSYELELELAQARGFSFGYRSFALQVRKLWFDDVCGDFLSLSTGLIYRDASTKFRKALSTPYHARANFEFHTAIGKEWSKGCDWIFRIYGVGAVGLGTKGSPWLRGDLFLWWNYHDCHQLLIYGQSYFGLGNQKIVPLDSFRGWGRIHHQSIDLGIGYRFHFGIYGWLRFDYLYRVYALSYPEKVNFFIISFDFPFCPF